MKARVVAIFVAEVSCSKFLLSKFQEGRGHLVYVSGFGSENNDFGPPQTKDLDTVSKPHEYSLSFHFNVILHLKHVQLLMHKAPYAQRGPQNIDNLLV